MAEAELEKLEYDGSEDVTALASDNRFIVNGHSDGIVAAFYKNRMPKFPPVKVSEHKITAICADDDVDFFYIGDEKGNLFVLDKKGKIVKTGKMPVKVAGAVLVIMNNTGSDFSFAAYTSKGSAYFKEATTRFTLFDNSPSVGPANYSMDRDGTFYENKKDGDDPVLCYNAKTEANVVSTVAVVESQKKTRSFKAVFSLVIADNKTYEDNIQAAEKKLSVRKGFGLGVEIKKIDFADPVKQVISCRHHTGGDAEQDHIYVLLCDGLLFKFNGTELFTDGPDMESGDPILNYYPEDFEGEKQLGGFAVYENKVAIYGNRGIYTSDV